MERKDHEKGSEPDAKGAKEDSSDEEWVPDDAKASDDDADDDEIGEPDADELAALRSALPRSPGDAADDSAPASLAVQLVTHYLAQIQPVVDELAAEHCALFAGLDPAEPDVSAAEHSLARHAAFVEFGARLDQEVEKWCAAQAVDERALAAALGMAARDEREGRETMATLLLTLLAAADDFGAFAGYMAGEAERQGYEPQAPPCK